MHLRENFNVRIVTFLGLGGNDKVGLDGAGWMEEYEGESDSGDFILKKFFSFFFEVFEVMF
jgi:hypothetical protein